MKHRVVLALTAFVCALVFAAISSAQDRPTLERIEAVMCAMADEQGQQFRPLFCEGRCDCALDPPLFPIIPGLGTAGASCQQQPNGRVQIEQRVEPHDVYCTGVCSEFPIIPCTESSPGCTCTGPGECIDYAIVGTHVSGSQYCADSTECDQSAGFTCPGPVGGSCEKTSHTCSVLGELCASGVSAPVGVFDFEFAPAGDLAPLACSEGGNISSTDAAACMAFAEATIGVGACVVCGDGNLDAGEQCDDGNLDAGDGCAPDCTSE